jgi:hypothetical protein
MNIVSFSMKKDPIRAFNNAFRIVWMGFQSTNPVSFDQIRSLEDFTIAIPGFRIPSKPISLADEQSNQHKFPIQGPVYPNTYPCDCVKTSNCSCHEGIRR